jgi:anti-sigma factor RsiW
MISEHPAEIVLLDYVEGTLLGEESDGVRRHIAVCDDCRRSIGEITRAIDELDRLPTAAALPSRSTGDRLRSALRLMLRSFPLGFAACAIVAALLLMRPVSTSPRAGTTRAPERPVPVRIPPGQRAVTYIRQVLASVHPSHVAVEPGSGTILAVTRPGRLDEATRLLQTTGYEGTARTVVLLGVTGPPQATQVK